MARSLPGRTMVSQANASAAHAHSGTYSLAETGLALSFRTLTDLSLAAAIPCRRGFRVAGRANHNAAHYLQSHGQHRHVVAGHHLRSQLAAVVAFVHRRRRGRGTHSSGPRSRRRYRLLGRHSHLPGRNSLNMSQAVSKRAEPVSNAAAPGLGKKILLLLFPSSSVC